MLTSVAAPVAVDVVLILTPVAGESLLLAGLIDSPPSNPSFWRDWSFAEMFNCIKLLTASVFMPALLAVTRSSLFPGFAVVFAVPLFDDALQLHERVGGVAVQQFDFRPILGLRAQDIGALFVWSLLGMVILAAVANGFHFSPRRYWSVGLALLAAVAGLVFCGVVVDMLGIFIHGRLERRIDPASGAPGARSP